MGKEATVRESLYDDGALGIGLERVVAIRDNGDSRVKSALVVIAVKDPHTLLSHDVRLTEAEAGKALQAMNAAYAVVGPQPKDGGA